MQGRDTPISWLMGLIGLALLPWLWQRRRNRDSRIGTSALDEADEKLWARIAVVAVPSLIVIAFFAKSRGWFHSWTEW